MLHTLNKYRHYIIAIGLAVLLPQASFACVDFIFQCKDDSYISGRSLEFAKAIPIDIMVHPREEKVQSEGPNKGKGIKWVSKYGYLSLEGFNTVVDGFNEKGLALNILWFPDVKYPANPASASDTVIDFVDIGRWLLGNFATIEEVKNALPKVQFFFHSVAELNMVPPIHFAIHDNQGKSIVVEFIDQKLSIFDNPVGVLTNAPEFPWHLTNLRNYINLTPVSPGPQEIGSLKLMQTGDGSGWRGMPGDWTPPTRFVRIAMFKQFLQQPATFTQGIAAAFHLLNTVDIPYGVVRQIVDNRVEWTQWVTVTDITHKKVYVRNYGDLTIQSYDLSKENLDPAPSRKLASIEPRP